MYEEGYEMSSKKVNIFLQQCVCSLCLSPQFACFPKYCYGEQPRGRSLMERVLLSKGGHRQ